MSLCSGYSLNAVFLKQKKNVKFSLKTITFVVFIIIAKHFSLMSNREKPESFWILFTDFPVMIPVALKIIKEIGSIFVKPVWNTKGHRRL